MKNKALLPLFAALSLLLSTSLPVLAGTDMGEFRWVVEQVLDGDVKPFAIGHRGYGENRGEIADQPLENTTAAVRRSFREGTQIVGIDTVLTRDQIAVALHDDFLADHTCVNSLTLTELKMRTKDVSTLRHILQKARIFSQQEERDKPSGQVVIEIKTPSPLCDPDDDSLPALIKAVLKEITFSQMAGQVMIESFSPEILAMVMMVQPDIPRMLAINILQILPPEVVAEWTGLPVTIIDKDAGFDLRWREIGPFYRLPSYYSDSPIGSYLTTLFGTYSHSASIDKLIMLQDPANAILLVELFHGSKLGVHIYTIDNADEWAFFSGMDVDGMYVNDIPMGQTQEEN